MKYLFYLFLSKVGIVLSGSGQLRLNNALSGFNKAKDELTMAIKHEITTIQKKDKELEMARKKFEEKQRILTEQTEAHMKTRKVSMAYLTKIEKFLDIEDPDIPELSQPE